MGKSAPQPTNPRETSAAQTGSNVSTAIANNMMTNITEHTPDGSTMVNRSGSYSYSDPYTGHTYTVPTFTRTTTLSPEQAAIKVQQDAAKRNLSTLANTQSQFLNGYLGQRITMDDQPRAEAPTLQTGYQNDFSADRNRVEQTLMDRMGVQLGRDREALDTKLSNQGIKVGSTAYNAAMDDANRATNDARMSAILSAGQEQSRLTDLSRQQAAFGNDARLQQFNAASQGRAQSMQEKFAVRNQPLNEIIGLLNGSQVQNPNFQGANIARIPTTDNAGIIGNYDNQRMQAWQQQQAMTGSIAGGLLGGLGNLFAGSFKLSDERLKTGKKKIATLYEYRYKGEPKGKKRIGVMAGELERTRPELVATDTDGFKRVDYGPLFNSL